MLGRPTGSGNRGQEAGCSGPMGRRAQISSTHMAIALPCLQGPGARPRSPRGTYSTSGASRGAPTPPCARAPMHAYLRLRGGHGRLAGRLQEGRERARPQAAVHEDRQAHRRAPREVRKRQQRAHAQQAGGVACACAAQTPRQAGSRDLEASSSGWVRERGKEARGAMPAHAGTLCQSDSTAGSAGVT